MNNPPADVPSGPQPPYQSPYPQSYSVASSPAEEVAAPPQQRSRRRGLLIGALVAVILVAVLVVVALAGGLSDFLGLGIMFVPLIVLAMLAYAGKKSVTAKVLTYIALAMTGVGMIFYSLIALLIGYVMDWDKFNALLERTRGGGLPSAQEMQGIFAPSAGAGLLLAMVLYLVAVIVAASMLLRPVRVLVSRVMPIDPDNFVHKIALSLIVLVFLSSLIPLLVLGGTPPLLNLVTGSGSEAGNGGPNVGGQSITVSQLSPLYQLIWTIPAVFIMAGWPIERKFPDMLKRLGLVRPSLVQVLFGIGFGFVLALLGLFVIDPVITWVWQAFGWPTTNAGAFDQLLGNLITPVGAVIVGVAAGLGEEMGARGLLQPRIGLIAANLVFTASHGFQYGADALLSVFIIGTILGVVRARANTSTSAIVHGMFDFTQLLAGALFPGS